MNGCTITLGNSPLQQTSVYGGPNLAWKKKKKKTVKQLLLQPAD
jgi:hypothetical protein